jgi:protein-disulfide isomerase
VQGDFVFFRHPEAIATARMARRAAWLAMAHGYFDYAEALLTRDDALGELGENALQAGLKSASQRYGRSILTTELYRQVRGFSPLLRSLIGYWPR